MTEPKEEPGEFKVVDRRSFTQEGERRPDAVIEPPKAPPPSPKAAAPEPPRSPAKSQPATAETARGARPGGHFEDLVMSLLTSGMLQMGLAAHPGQPPQPPDLTAAQGTIDLLATLQEKTKGNLTKEEEEILTGGLYELRMVFVELNRRMGRPVR